MLLIISKKYKKSFVLFTLNPVLKVYFMLNY